MIITHNYRKNMTWPPNWTQSLNLNLSGSTDPYGAVQCSTVNLNQQYVMQQNWSQWENYQQQYAQWQAQYGEQVRIYV